MSTEHPDSADGDELTARLRAADPASSLPPVAPEGVARLLEDAMSHDTLSETPETAVAAAGRGRLTWLVAAAAAVVVVAGVGAYAVLGGDDSSSPPAADEPPGDPTVTELQAPGSQAYETRCMVPTARVLADKPVAFSGSVQSVEGDVVTLAPDRWYAGDATDLVTVDAPGEQLEALLSAVSFEDGKRYLVAADDQGDVMVCGFSAEYSDGLAQVYDEAFAS